MVKWAPCSCRELKVLLLPVHPSLTHIYWSRLWSDDDHLGHDDHDNIGQQSNVHTVAFEKLKLCFFYVQCPLLSLTHTQWSLRWSDDDRDDHKWAIIWKKVFSSLTLQTYQKYIQEVLEWLSMTFLASFLKKETLVVENYCWNMIGMVMVLMTMWSYTVLYCGVWKNLKLCAK